MSLPGTLEDREYQKFLEDELGGTAVNIRGKVEVIEEMATGIKFLEKFIGALDPGVETDAINFTVGVGLTRTLSCLRASSFRAAKIRVYKGAEIIATGRVGAGAYNLALNFLPTEQILEGEEVTITFEGLSNEPASDIELFLSGTES